MRYPYRVYKTKVEKHEFWVAESTALKGCVGQGDAQEEALEALELNEECWLETAQECGIDIPEVPTEEMAGYSGKLTLRVAPYVHKEAAEQAKRQNVSLNQYINDAIVAQNARLLTVGYIAEEVTKAAKEIKRMMPKPKRSVTSGENETILFSTRNVENSYRIGATAELSH